MQQVEWNMSKDNKLGTDGHISSFPGRDPYGEYDRKRYKGRCRFYSYDGDKCTCSYGWRFEKRCLGSWKCIEYEEITEEEFKERQNEIRKENRRRKKQEAISSGTAGAPAGTGAETPSESPKRRYKGRCRFYSYDGERCRCKSSPCYKSKCKGSGGCREYRAVTEGVFRNRQKKQAEAKNKQEVESAS